MRTNAAIGLPLTFLQLFAFRSTGVPIDFPILVHNFVVSEAVYGADRIDGPLLSPERRLSQLCAFGVAGWYLTDPQTRFLAPVILGLHLGYKPAKPFLAPVKPLFVAWWWTVCVYYLPALHLHMENNAAPISSAAFYLSIVSLSTAVDVIDCIEDRREGVITPAASLGPEAKGFAVACALSAWILDQSTQKPCLMYDVGTVCAAYGIAFNQTLAAYTTFAVCLISFVSINDIYFVDMLLMSSQVIHDTSIKMLSACVGYARHLQDPYKNWLLDYVFLLAKKGDDFGHMLLLQYEKLANIRL